MENAAEASAATAAAAAGVRPPRPANWGKITRGQRQHWKQQGGRPRQNSGRAAAGGAEDKDEDAVGRVVGGEEVEGLARVF